jgi:hypothetical protein
MSYDPNPEFNKTCLQCGNTFVTRPWWNKDYCDVRCRKLAKRRREKERVRVTVARNTAGMNTVQNPTILQLDNFADVIARGKQEVQLFGGNIPMWNAPTFIRFEPYAENRQEWLMQRDPPFEEVVTVTVTDEPPTKEFNALEILDRLGK